jgi:hypothetical protein
MMWLTWRQFRVQALATAAFLAVIAVALAATAAHLVHLYNASGIATCRVIGNCGPLTSNFLHVLENDPVYSVLYYLGIGLLFVVPAVIGVFWGAPLITREIEAGTYRLAWNQSVTRTRWLTVKLGLVGLAAMGSAGLLSLMVTWWSSPVQRVAPLVQPGAASFVDRFSPVLFGARGIAPVGYAAFAFVLGVTTGVLIRRTVPAMATTLAAFAGIQIAFPLWIRPHLIAPVHTSAALTAGDITGLSIGQNGHVSVFGAANHAGAWILSSQTTNAAGHAFTGPAPHACLSPASGFQACESALVQLHLRLLASYQPASRYWAFQWYETGIFLAAALLLAGFCFWRVRRRTS